MPVKWLTLIGYLIKHGNGSNMVFYFSGGTAIAETSLDPPAAIMLSFYNDVSKKSGKPGMRMKKIMRLRKKGKKRETSKK